MRRTPRRAQPRDTAISRSSLPPDTGECLLFSGKESCTQIIEIDHDSCRMEHLKASYHTILPYERR